MAEEEETMRRVLPLALLFGLMDAAGCLKSDDSVSDAEVATSVVSGALNNSSGSVVGWNDPGLRDRRTGFDRLWQRLSPVGTAHAASWSCTGDMLDPRFSGPGAYSFTPFTCQVSWGVGHSVSSTWSSTFQLDYGMSCDRLHPFIGNQAAGCTLTRTTAAGGNTRTITGPDGNVYAITHDTNGANSGWDSSVSPAPSNGGAVVTCGAGGCVQGGSLVINGSHLYGTVTIGKKAPEKIWDHTVSTDATGITVTGEGTSRVVSGAVTVQHNLAKYTATVTFAGVGYADANCCFPTTGSVSSKIDTGSHAGQSETLTFGSACGEATLTGPNGTASITLQNCL
jgi:hypothetical protein